MSVSVHPAGTFDPSLDIANGNFCHLWAMLGIPAGEDGCLVGRIHWLALQRRLDAIKAPWAIRPEVQEGNMITCAITHAQAERYWIALRGICRVACERGAMVEWA